MRTPRPPSTQSGSTASSRGLVSGTHRSRRPPPDVFLPGDGDKSPGKGRTKVIIILGVALPVLACIIGIAAWAVTTDVLRISPRPHDNAYDRFGHQGKTRIDSLHDRSDQDIDIFHLHSISSRTSPNPPVKEVTRKATSKAAGESTLSVQTFVEEQTTTTPKVSEILSRLISDMPVSKNPKNFVVFAPVADARNIMNPANGRRFDGKVVVHEGEDLVAEESSVSEEISEESPNIRNSTNRKRKTSKEYRFSIKSAETSPSGLKETVKLKNNQNTHVSEAKRGANDSLQNIKNKTQKNTDDKFHSDLLSNRNSGGLQIRPNMNFPNTQIASKAKFPVHENSNIIPSQFLNTDASNNNNANAGTLLDKLLQNSRLFPNQNNNNLPMKGNSKNFLSIPQGSPNFMANKPLPHHISHNQNQPLHQISFKSNLPSQQQMSSNQNQQQMRYPDVKPSIQSSLQNKAHLTSQNNLMTANNQHTSLQNPSFPSQNNHQAPANFGSNLSQNNQGHHNQLIAASSSQNQYSLASLAHHTPPLSFPNNAQSSNQNIRIITNNQQPQNPALSSNNYNANNQYGSVPVDASLSSNGPQYFAPPPQMFHTKTTYDRSSTNFGTGSSLSTYEKAAQTVVDKPKDSGVHLHHHHHHHHDPIASNSDPIGDVNLSDVQRNDADRLGSIGVGLGGPRGITVQIGGGGGGGGITSLLPIGALGVAKNILATLLPRPSFGLNSKVFLGVEVGRGTGMNMMG